MQADTNGILDLLPCPGFFVKDSRITSVNQAAAAMLITPGTEIGSLLLTGGEEYAAFQEGCLYLKLNLVSGGWGACVTQYGDSHCFLLDPLPSQDPALQALGLAARELRTTLSGAMASAQLLAAQVEEGNTEAREQLARLNRGLYRTLRVIGNMSDAGSWPYQDRLEIRSAGKILSEIFEKAQATIASAGYQLVYQGLQEDIFTLINREQLERAVLNILSNAMKFSPVGSTIRASLTRRGRLLMLSITDPGSGVQENLRGSLFSRYMRQGSLEDSRFGLGLGMVLIRSVAVAHGGTVLVDQPEGTGTRVTVTLAIRQSGEGGLRSPALRPDYAGERDPVLLELSDCLPYELYQEF